MKAVTSTLTFIHCPNCRHRGRSCVDDLNGFGPWYCDHCGTGFKGKKVDGEWKIEYADVKHTTLILLELELDCVSAYFIVKGMCFAPRGVTPVIDKEHGRYFIQEHTCPTNFIPCEAIIHRDDADPHGLFRYVDEILVPKDFDFDEQLFFDDWADLFPTLKGVFE